MSNSDKAKGFKCIYRSADNSRAISPGAYNKMADGMMAGNNSCSISSENISLAVLKVDGQLCAGRFKTELVMALPSAKKMSYEKLLKQISKIPNDDKNKATKEKAIDSILGACRFGYGEGYFFDQNNAGSSSPTRVIYYLENCQDCLESFISDAREDQDFHERWTILPDLCRQLAEGVAWLHLTYNISHEGQINPRTVVLQNNTSRTLNNTRFLKVIVPDRLNPFIGNGMNKNNELFELYWAGPTSHLENKFQKDMISVAMLIFYIQTCGNHPYQVDNQFKKDLKAIRENINSKQFNILELKSDDVSTCFCKDKNCNVSPGKMSCRYRSWINLLAHEAIHQVLRDGASESSNQPSSFGASYADEGTSTNWMKHPFFWTNEKRLRFLQRASNYLSDVASNTFKSNFTPIILDAKKIGEMSKSHSDVMAYFQEPPPFLAFPRTKNINKNAQQATLQNSFTLFELIRGIRNKSIHWKDARSTTHAAAEMQLGQISFIESPTNQVEIMGVFPEKYCLFWMCYFPHILVHTWEKFKDNVNTDDFGKEFY